MRLVSLLPSATEIVYALGLGDQLVGVTFECDEPARARRDKSVVVGGREGAQNARRNSSRSSVGGSPVSPLPYPEHTDRG